jgi:pyrroloquinoline quinone biosynthesis protein B
MVFEVYLLGTAQDAGLPQAGCYCPNCVDARSGRLPRGFAASLALIDHKSKASWIVDATPDFREQFHMFHEHAPDCELKGILLTHGHVGHYAGLLHLRREAMNTNKLNVYATPSLCSFLASNGPWGQLVKLGNITLNEIYPGQRLKLSSGLFIEPITVPHRAEYTDTVAFLVKGNSKTIFYCPDIDSWDAWVQNLPQFLESVDVALLDGTFFSREELADRNIEEIPHPLVRDTVAKIKGTPCSVFFIHLNHSNPLNRDGAAREWLRSQGMSVAGLGASWEL